MAGNLGTLAVYLTANTDKFDSRISSAMRTLSNLAGQFAGFATSGLSIGGAFEMARRATNEYLAEVEDLRKMSNVFGMSIGDIDGLADAAKMAQVDVSSLTTSLRAMQRGIGDATPSLEYRTALAEIGLTIEQLKSLNPSEQFQSIARSLADVKSPTDQAALALQLFGRSGNELLPMLREGSEGFDKLMGASERFGVNMSEAGVKAALEFNQSMREMGYAWESLKMKLVEGVTIPIVAGGMALKNADKQGEKLGVSESSGSGIVGGSMRFFESYAGGFIGKGDRDQMYADSNIGVRSTDSISAQELTDAMARRRAQNEADAQRQKDIADAKEKLGAEEAAKKQSIADRKLVVDAADEEYKAYEEQTKARIKAEEELAKSREDLKNAQERAFLENATREEKINFFLDRRKSLYDELIAADDELSRNKAQLAITETEQQLNRLAKDGQDKKTNQVETRLSAAMERGSVEAYSAIAKSGEKTQDKIEKNTAKSVQVQEKIVARLESIGGVAVATI